MAFSKQKMAARRRKVHKINRSRKAIVVQRPRSNLRTQRVSASIGQGFPRRLLMTHRYVDNITLTSTAAALATHQFSVNSMFDPNTTGVGHQPLYYDQLTPLYNHYTVIGSKITVQITPKATNEEPTRFVLFLEDNTTVTPTDIGILSEQTGAKVLQIGPNSNFNYTRSLKWSARKNFPGAVLGNDQLRGTNANPAEQQYFTLGCQSSLGGTTTEVQCYVTIQYIAVWTEPKQVDNS